MKKLPVAGLGWGKHRMKLEHLVPKNKGCSRNDEDMPKGHKRELE